MRRYRPLTVLLLSIGIPALVGGVFGRRALALDDNIAEQQKTFVAALRAIETELRRRSRVRPASVQRHPRDARHARPPFQLLRSQRIRADARAPGRPVLRPRDHDRRHRRRHRGAERVRGVAGEQDGRAPRRCHRPDRGRRREGVVDRAGDGQAARAEGHERPHRGQAPRLRAVDSARSHARRSPHPHRPRLLHGRCDHRLHPHEGFRREHRPRGEDCAAAISPSRA